MSDIVDGLLSAVGTAVRLMLAAVAIGVLGGLVRFGYAIVSIAAASIGIG